MKLGRVYRINHHQSNITYIGSTFNTLRQRFMIHKKKGETTCISKYINKFGKKNFSISLIKEYQVVDKQHLHAWEQIWINKLNCINKQGSIPLLNKRMNALQKKEWYKKNKEHIKEYREKNKEKRKERMKEWREKNKEYLKEYREKNKEKRKEYEKQRNKLRKHCDICDCDVGRKDFTRHTRTKKHIRNMNN